MNFKFFSCRNIFELDISRPFVKDLEAFVKWILIHNIYRKTFMNNLIVCLHQLISIVKFEVFNDSKIMPNEARLKNHPQGFGHVCVDEWFPKSTCSHSF